MRHIDDSKPLSDEDRQWLTDWCRFSEIARIDAMHSEEAVEQESSVAHMLGGPQSGSDASGEPEEPENPLKGDDNASAQAAAEQEDRVPDNWTRETEDEPYDDWTGDELRDELAERGLTKSGNKDDLIQRLRESDESPNA